MGGWVDWIEEHEAVGMSCWTLWVGGWVSFFFIPDWTTMASSLSFFCARSTIFSSMVPWVTSR